MDFAEYRRLFGRPATDKWSLQYDSSNREIPVSVLTPNNYEISLLQNDGFGTAFWTRRYDTEHASTALWVRSLWWVVLLAEAGQVELAKTILDRYHDFWREIDFDPNRRGMNSQDHCLALNLRTCARIIINPEFVDTALRVTAVELAESLVRVVEQADHFKPNNHGLMLALAVLHAEYANPQIGRREGRFVDSEYCIDFLNRTFEFVISDSGLVAENSPSYQGLWVEWLRESAEVVERLYQQQELSERYRELAERVRQNLRFFIVDQHRMLPIGDGGSVTQATVPPRQGVFVSEPDGYYIENNGAGTVVAFNCGFRSGTHKHADDQAIRLWIAGEEVIADAGAYSYDMNDPRVLRATSQRGHSSVFFPKFDDISGPHFYPWLNAFERIRTDFTQTKDEVVREFRTQRVIDETFKVSRILTSAPKMAYLRIDDFATGPSEECPGVRFLIPREHDVVVDGRRVVIKSSKFIVALEFSTEPDSISVYSPEQGFDDTLLSSGEYPFLCPRPGEAEACSELVAQMKPEGVHRWSLSTSITWVNLGAL